MLASFFPFFGSACSPRIRRYCLALAFYIEQQPALPSWMGRSRKGCTLLPAANAHDEQVATYFYAKQGRRPKLANPALATLSSTCFFTTPTFASCKHLYKRLRPSGSTASQKHLDHGKCVPWDSCIMGSRTPSPPFSSSFWLCVTETLTLYLCRYLYLILLSNAQSNSRPQGPSQPGQWAGCSHDALCRLGDASCHTAYLQGRTRGNPDSRCARCS